MSKVKFQYARELIKEKRYLEAKTILEELDHPTAAKWINEIDKRIDEIPDSTETKLIKEKSKNKPSGKARSTQLLIIGIVCICVLGLAILRLQENTSITSTPFEDISSKMIEIDPELIKIDDTQGTGIPDSFLQQVRLVISNSGYVRIYQGEINDDDRFETFVEVRLDSSRNNRATAYNTLEDILKLYVAKIEPETYGSISIGVVWDRESECFTNLGVGYQTIQSIDWDSVTQSQIFESIDKGIYGHNIDGTGNPYGEVAWSPIEPLLTACAE